jgi:hypothetical protein
MVDRPDDCPIELWVSIQEFWSESEWINAVNIARKESALDAFALADTTSEINPCGTIIGERNGVRISAERSVGYFQINSCDFPEWEWQRFYNARHNAGTAHALYDSEGKTWRPWFFSAKSLGLI